MLDISSNDHTLSTYFKKLITDIKYKLNLNKLEAH
jgi:hypothetical protein